MSVFKLPQFMRVYPDGSFRFVSYPEITVGSEVVIGYTDDGKPIKKIVIEILEKGPSRGVFNEAPPYSYHLTAK